MFINCSFYYVELTLKNVLKCIKHVIRGEIMSLIERIKGLFITDKNVKQSRELCSKLHDSHVKYASEKIDGTDTIIGRDGHLNIVEEKIFEYTVGVKSIFRFNIDEMTIWEFMSLDGAVITGIDLNTKKERTVTVYYDKHLT